MADTNKVLASNDKVASRSASISFRRACASDKAFLLNLRTASMDEHLKAAGIFLDEQAHMLRINEYFSDSHIILYQGIAIGLLKLGHDPNNIHIRQFQLLPKYHGVGIGSRVLKLLKRKAQEKQRAITLNVLIANPAKQLYLRHDFVVTGINELEYSMRWPTPR